MNPTPALLALALALSATIAQPAAADLIISSSDPSVNQTSANSSFFTLGHNNNDPFIGVSFAVAQESNLDSVVANLAVESNITANLTAQLVELGTPENDAYGTPSYQYTLLGSSATLTVSGNNDFTEQTISFSGQELDPGNTYVVFLRATFPQTGYVDWANTMEPASDFATPFGSISSGTWYFTMASDQSSLVYNNVPNQTPELTINAMVATPEPSTLVLATTGLAVAGLAARVQARRRTG